MLYERPGDLAAWRAARSEMRDLAPRMMDVMSAWRSDERKEHTALGLQYRQLYERFKAKQEGVPFLMRWYRDI